MSTGPLPGGHNFAGGNSLPVWVVDSAKTVLVPEDLFEPGTEEAFLRFNGMALSAGEKALVSEPRGGIVAVMAILPEAWETLGEHFTGGGLKVSSPLVEMAAAPPRSKRCVRLFITGCNVYITVWEKGLRLAEVLPWASHDDILYYVQVLGRRFALRKFDLLVGGAGEDIVGGVLVRYFNKVKGADFGTGVSGTSGTSATSGTSEV